MENQIGRALSGFVMALEKEQQQRFNEGLQRDLINVLIDGKVHAKALQLLDEQHKLERSLFEERECLLRDLQCDPDLEGKLLENDMRIVEIFDEVRLKQQTELHAFKVPGFRITKNNREIELQIMILEFIQSLEY